MARYRAPVPKPVPVTDYTFTADGRDVPAQYAPLWWHLAGKQYTASGYGRRIPSPFMVAIDGRRRRVYVCIYGNSGTSYVEGGPNRPDGSRGWIIIDRWAK